MKVEKNKGKLKELDISKDKDIETEIQRERGEGVWCGVLQRDSVGSQSQWLVASQREKSLVRVFALDAREQMNPCPCPCPRPPMQFDH